MSNFTPLAATIGGLLIGVAISLLLVLNGQLAGVTGILAGLFQGDPKRNLWRPVFLVGMIAGGVAATMLIPGSFDGAPIRSAPALMIAGVLVGFGTRLARGCTSGHGLCGLARFSKRSFAAVCTFMGAGMIVATVIGRFFGGRV